MSVQEQVTSCLCPLKLKELIDKEEEEEDEEDGHRCRSLRFGCVLQLSFPHHRQTTRAAAVVEDSFTCSGEAPPPRMRTAPPPQVCACSHGGRVLCAGPDVLLQRRCSLMRRVTQGALVQAFASVLLILLGSVTVLFVY